MKWHRNLCAGLLVSFCLASNHTRCTNLLQVIPRTTERNSIGDDGRRDLERLRNPRDRRPRGSSEKSTESERFGRLLNAIQRLLHSR